MSNTYLKKDLHQSPDPRKRLGVKGEDYACLYLQKRGMEILERNVRFKKGELDIVARDKTHICFIEVKTRSNLNYGRPSLALTDKKQHTIRLLAEWYLKLHKEYTHLSPRIDVLEVLLLPNGKIYVNYIIAAF